MVHPVGGLLKGILTTGIYVSESLRISVKQGKPAALYLDHHPVAPAEAVIDVGQYKAYAGDLTGVEGFGFLK